MVYSFDSVDCGHGCIDDMRRDNMPMESLIDKVYLDYMRSESDRMCVDVTQMFRRFVST